jgi:ferritin
MASSRFADLLSAQVANEFAAHQQYVAIAVHYDAEALEQLAALFYQQALEERNHAMMLVQYLIDADLPVKIPGVEAPQAGFSTLTEPASLALAQERRVSEQIAALAQAARDAGDYQGEQFMQWFLKEQVEEVAKMSTLLRIIERAGENALAVEDYLARQPASATADPTAPRAAGGAL